jgi:excisionase family DNA binding protein
MDTVSATIRDKLLDVREAAEFLRVAPKTLYGLVSQRRIPFRKAGRRLLFLESELLEWTRPEPDRGTRHGNLMRRQ